MNWKNMWPNEEEEVSLAVKLFGRINLLPEKKHKSKEGYLQV
jgi:hypothetical protein